MKIRLIHICSFSLILFVCFAFSCHSRKNTIAYPTDFATDTAVITKTAVDLKNDNISRCDSIRTVLFKNYESYKPNITNLDPSKQVFPVTKLNRTYYQIEWNDVKIFNKYELWFDDIKFLYTLGNDDCRLVGDKVFCYVDIETLGEYCIKTQSNYTNIYACIYDKSWNIKVKGIVCDVISGPFSDVIKLVDFQCGP